MPTLSKIALTTFGSATGALTLPTIILLAWFPREINDLQRSIDENQKTLSVVEENLRLVVSSSSATEERVLKLAETRTETDRQLGYAIASLGPKTDGFTESLLQQHLPNDIIRRWSEEGKVEKLRFIRMNGSDIFYVNTNDWGEFSVRDREILRSAERNFPMDVRVRDPYTFPGYTFTR